MKISVICICVFLICTLHWAADTRIGVASAESAVPSTTTNIVQENATEISSDEPQRTKVDTGKKSDEIVRFSDEVKSSVKEVLNNENVFERPEFVESVSQNSVVAHEISGTGLNVHTVIDSAILGLQERAQLSESVSTSTTTSYNESPNFTADVSDEKPPVIVEPLDNNIQENISVKVEFEEKSDNTKFDNKTEQTEQINLEVPSSEPKINATEKPSETHEEIPSFSEWAQKQLEEAEKKKEQVNSSAHNQQTNGIGGSSLKKRWKNYASPDCGAKIIAANPEAVSAGSVLSSSRDEYKLNTCTSRIWFIVELCEAIQAKKIDLANFELFSSSPKDFSLFVGDRFPTRDWLTVGHFTAKDERDIQSFDLSPNLFGKYIKFEMHSHYGSEHYCPISLFRVYGTSEFEVLETENEEHRVIADDDDDDEETLDSRNGDSTINLFSSATDAVISIVKKAAQVLGNKGNTSTSTKEADNKTSVSYSALIKSCTTPSHLVVCDNCSDLLYGNVYELMSCNSKQLALLISNPIIRNSLYNSDVCSHFGLNFEREFAPTVSTYNKFNVSSFFALKFVAALCNTLAVDECKVLRNVSSNTTEASNKVKPTRKISNPTHLFHEEPITHVDEISITDTLKDLPSTLLVESSDSNISYTTQINPTKTLTSDEDLNLTETLAGTISVEYKPTGHPSSSYIENNQSESDSSTESDQNGSKQEFLNDLETVTESSENLDDHLEALVSELNGDSSANVATTTTPPSVPQGQKESVFLRLSNRIKALERNLSLSSQYLEELSRRYKKQVEEMQRLLDKTINTFSEENIRKDERASALEEQVALLRESVESLVEEKNSWLYTTYWLVLSGITILGTLLFCRRSSDVKHSGHKTQTPEIQRRNSVDVITHTNHPPKKRRPSEEAMKAGGTTCSDLMIDELGSNQKTKDRRRKRKKNLHQFALAMNEEGDVGTNDLKQKFAFAPKSTSSQVFGRPEGHNNSDWLGEVAKQSRISDIPFALDESDVSQLETLPVIQQSSEKVKINGNASFIVSDTDSKTKKMFYRSKTSRSNHKKSASFDDSKSHRIQSTNNMDTISFNDSPVVEAPKKEKKSTLRKFFKNLNFK